MARWTYPLTAVAGIVAVTLAGCTSQSETTPADNAGGSTTQGEVTHYPLTMDNCGEDIGFDSAPERVVLLESAPVTILDRIGALDTVIARAGAFPPGYYDADLEQRIDAIDSLSDDIDGSGHLQITPEAAIAYEPDLARLPDGLSRAGLLDGDAHTLIQPNYCPTGEGDATFDSLYEQVLDYGQIFDRLDEAEQLVTDLQGRVTAVETETAGGPERTAAVLYPSVGGGPLYAYGRASMAQPQLDAAGLTNVYLGRDPDVLILLYQDEEEGILEEVTNLPGSDALRALDNDDVLVQLFNFTEPVSPLTVTGLEQIAEQFGTGS